MHKTNRTKKIELLGVGETLTVQGSMYFPANLRNSSKGRKYTINNMGTKIKNGAISFTWKITRVL